MSTMRKTLLSASFFLTAFALIGSPGLNWNCLEGQNDNQSNGNCAAGRVTFTGGGYPATVHISVTRTSTAQVIDDYDYETTGGNIEFTETLVPADTYSVNLVGANVAVSRSITTYGGN